MESEKTETKPKYSGYGYHGGGRKKRSESGRKNFALSLQQEEIDFIKAEAEKSGMKYSRFVMEAVRFYSKTRGL